MNPNNLNQLADNLYDVVETPVSVKLLEVLSEQQRNYLTILIKLWSYGDKTRDGKDPVVVAKEMLDSAKAKIKPRLSPQRELYKSIKKYE